MKIYYLKNHKNVYMTIDKLDISQKQSNYKRLHITQISLPDSMVVKVICY